MRGRSKDVVPALCGVRFPLGSREYEASFLLRMEVLLKPFAIDPALVREDDERSEHFGLFVGERCVACLLLIPESSGTLRMRQVAVQEERQRTGLGRRLVEMAEDFARQQGQHTLIAHARMVAVPFYEALGYEPYGGTFLEVGMEHQSVKKELGQRVVKVTTDGRE